MSRRKSSRAPRRNKAENLESSVLSPAAAQTIAPTESVGSEIPSEKTSPLSELDQLDADWD
jgi:hypothetical protein